MLVKVRQAFYVYILRCADGSYYVGHTDNLQRRVKAHNEGGGAKFTCKRRPVRLVYTETHDGEEAAVRRERQLKKWSRAKKEALIAGDRARLKQLSRRRR